MMQIVRMKRYINFYKKKDQDRIQQLKQKGGEIVFAGRAMIQLIISLTMNVVHAVG